MKLDDLTHVLDELGIRPTAYTLDGGRPDNRYGIEQRGSAWYVYYAERGEVTWERLCVTEEEACDLFVHELVDDPTTRATP